MRREATNRFLYFSYENISLARDSKISGELNQVSFSCPQMKIPWERDNSSRHNNEFLLPGKKISDQDFHLELWLCILV